MAFNFLSEIEKYDYLILHVLYIALGYFDNLTHTPLCCPLRPECCACAAWSDAPPVSGGAAWVKYIRA